MEARLCSGLSDSGFPASRKECGLQSTGATAGPISDLVLGSMFTIINTEILVTPIPEIRTLQLSYDCTTVLILGVGVTLLVLMGVEDEGHSEGCMAYSRSDRHDRQDMLATRLFLWEVGNLLALGIRRSFQGREKLYRWNKNPKP